MVEPLTATPSGPSGAHGGDVLRVLELLAERSQTALEPERTWAAIAAAAANHLPQAWTRVLVEAAPAAGLRADVGAYEVDDLIARAAPSAPAVTFCDGRWLIVGGRRGGRIDATIVEGGEERHARLGPRRLARMLRLGDADARATWVLVEPALPLDALHGRRLGPQADQARHAMARLSALLRLERDDLWVVVVFAVAIGALTLASPIAVQALVNTVAFGALLQPLLVLAILLFAGLSFAAALKGFKAYVVEILQQRFFVRAVADIARRLPRVDLRAHDAARGPELVNRFFDVVTVQKAGASLLLDGVSVALQAAVGLALLAFYHPLLLAFDVVLLAGLAVIVFAPMRAAIGTSLEESHAKYATVAWLEEVARNPALFKSRAATVHAVARAELLSRGYLAARRAHFSRLLTQIAGGLGLQVIASVALLGVGGLLVLERQLTLGQLVAAELVVSAIAASFAKLGKHLEAFYDLLSALQKLGKLVDLPLESTGEVAEFGSGPARVRLRGVSVDARRSALSGLDAEISVGERVLVDGPGGAGKSALLDLCFGLRAPDRGAVEIDGIDLRIADLPVLRGQLAQVRPGDLFAGTLLDNLRVGSPDAEVAAVRVALSLVDLDDVVAALPEALATPILPTGGPLSSTQARRLVLARALVAEPRLLLIDGALDGLKLPPPKFEALLDHIFAPDAPWTVLVVSDEPAVRARCTRVLRLEP